MSRPSRWKWLTYSLLVSVLLATQLVSAPSLAETYGSMEEVAGFTLIRSPGDVAFSWETSEPTTSQVYVQWSLSGKPAGEPVLFEDSGPGLHHDLTLPAPNPTVPASPSAMPLESVAPEPTGPASGAGGDVITEAFPSFVEVEPGSGRGGTDVRVANPRRDRDHCASDVGPGGEADFGYEVTMPCDLVFSIVDAANRTVWRTTLSSQAGGYLYTWPGIALRSEGYPILFNAILAPPGRYTIIVSASRTALPVPTDEARAEFSVVW